MSTADVVIVGGGLEGAAAAWALSQRGITDVVVLERGTVGSGMTGKSSGIVRCHYGVSSLAAMATVGLEVFEKAEEIFGTDIGFRQTGYVVGVGEPNVESLRKSLAAQREVGVQTEEIDKSEVARMWPWADLSPFAAFGWEARGGYGDAYQTAQAFAAAARSAGVRIRQGTPAAGLVLDGDRVTGVRTTDGETVSADTVIVATGVWTQPFLAPYGIDVPIRVVREQIVLIDPGVEIGKVPVFSDLVSLQYIRPEVGGEILFGNSDLSDAKVDDPDNYLNRADEAFIDLTVDRVGTRFPGFPDAAITSSYAGCYDATPDWNPVISRTGIDGLIVAAGFSGHGFKIAPAVGKLVADLVVDGRSSDPRIPETDFRLSRFTEGDLLTSPFPYVGAGQMR
ncbi:FAD dependent oxidoreductase [Mycolicibacterium phlei]|jgi:sarcosine oxidase subunit beta|uniref:FAD-dependent oxidoreductase n=1 Tax=Mycolicibacterium phlei DSM 43239 = CCUG 21000 TaxID=1226750 RepID=A0A5N5VEN1_MYCPH|nr:FAD-binding oxidoreductase [Mycolicibacterium phlei]VEG07304.1 FAD dependent oxidoreductase [Mycobacteroides chelonae]AMO59172.1 4-methylaminobutanoate oxidase (formaldehyde-forming) [Mycolicibacterium phlei]KAB7759090.1 FAD-dependent oxidoreductase [Mycolicibacterium phlei DSM 43239 = CCUG 21000]KXW59691.1 FAD-dependent oxidoreductase [Mycolicibacterium phlei DSM 43072]KXW67574.1 FAD-dependent oxidoreductase [Mycolicibacterium phlei DSM 43239 = CCUG 21000]